MMSIYIVLKKLLRVKNIAAFNRTYYTFTWPQIHSVYVIPKAACLFLSRHLSSRDETNMILSNHTFIMRGD